MRLFNTISPNLTTGVFTDYFDLKSIKYDLIEGVKLNNSNFFSIGKVRTIVCEDGDFEDENIHLGLGYLDKVSEGDFLIVQGSENYAYFGELMSRLSLKRNLSGACILGKTRDSRFTKDIFPVWSNGLSPVDIKSRGRVSEVGSEFTHNGIIVNETKYVVADNDGLVLFDIDLNEIFSDIDNEIKHETKIKDLIESGSTVEDILKTKKSF